MEDNTEGWEDPQLGALRVRRYGLETIGVVRVDVVGEVFVRLPEPTTSLSPVPPRLRGRHLVSDVVRLTHSEGVELGEAVEVFLAERDLARTSRRVYALTLAALIQDLGATTDVVTVGRRDLAQFLRRRHAGGAPESWNRVVATLGSFFAYCDRQRWVGASPAVGLEHRRERTGRSQALPTRAIGRTSGPLFLATRTPASARQPAQADLDPDTGRARLSYRRAAHLFTEASGGWTLHQLRHSRLTH